MTQKRLAIQIFGHLRTFDKTYESFYENVIKPNQEKSYEIDVFMHVWDELEYQAVQWHNEGLENVRGAKLTDEQISFVKDNYKPVSFEYTPQLVIDDEQVFPEFTGGKTPYKTMKNVYFTKYRVNQLRQEYEKENKVEYDFVLNTRADILYKNPLDIDAILEPYDGLIKDFETVENKLFYVGTHRAMTVKEDIILGASDIIYFGRPNVMNEAAEIYNKLEDKEFVAKYFRSWENFLVVNVQLAGFKTVQTNYASLVDWQILRIKDTLPKKIKKKKRKLISIRTKKYYIHIKLCGFNLKIGFYND